MDTSYLNNKNLNFKELFIIILISGITFSIASIWNTAILDIINTIYPLHIPENKYKHILLQFLYTGIVTIILLLIIYLLYKRM
jgi:hypothetical protein